jgi:hypothetical protein
MHGVGQNLAGAGVLGVRLFVFFSLEYPPGGFSSFSSMRRGEERRGEEYD